MFEPWWVTKETNQDLYTGPALKMNQMWGDPSCLVSPVPSCLVVWMQLTDVNLPVFGGEGFESRFQQPDPISQWCCVQLGCVSSHLLY